MFNYKNAAFFFTPHPFDYFADKNVMIHWKL